MITCRAVRFSLHRNNVCYRALTFWVTAECMTSRPLHLTVRRHCFIQIIQAEILRGQADLFNPVWSVVIQPSGGPGTRLLERAKQLFTSGATRFDFWVVRVSAVRADVCSLSIFFFGENHNLPTIRIRACKFAWIVAIVAIWADVGPSRIFLVREDHNFLTIRIRAHEFALLIGWHVRGVAVLHSIVFGSMFAFLHYLKVLSQFDYAAVRQNSTKIHGRIDQAVAADYRAWIDHRVAADLRFVPDDGAEFS